MINEDACLLAGPPELSHFRMPIVWYSNAVMFEQEEADEGTVMLVAPAPLMALQTPSALFHWNLGKAQRAEAPSYLKCPSPQPGTSVKIWTAPAIIERALRILWIATKCFNQLL